MESGSSADREALYRAAVGPAKADYYVPRFLRFDQPGASPLSWNWPSFFVSFYWFLYRRMLGNWALFCLLIPFGIVVVMEMVASLTGAEGATLGFAMSVIYSHGVLPMYSNALYHRAVSKRIEALRAQYPNTALLVAALERQSSTGTVAYVILPMLMLIALGILAGILVPAYQAFAVRGQVGEGLMLAARVKGLVERRYTTTHAWAESLDLLSGRPTRSSSNVADVSVDHGTVSIHYGNKATSDIAGQTLSFRPSLGDHGEILWTCGMATPRGRDPDSGAAGPNLTTLKPPHLPIECR